MGILSVNHLIRASIRRVYVEGVLLFVRLKSVDRSLLILPVKATDSSTELSFADALLHRFFFRFYSSFVCFFFKLRVTDRYIKVFVYFPSKILYARTLFQL